MVIVGMQRPRVAPRCLSIVLAATIVEAMAFSQWEPRFLDQYPLAVCNDGSPAAYYYRPGNPTLRRWFVFLEGAGWCWDQASCARPWHTTLGTSVQFPRTAMAVANWGRSLQGIFETDGQSPFQDMNIAYVRTCSNDAFMGDTQPQPGSGRQAGRSWHFRGRRIIEATFLHLRESVGMGTQIGDRVVYGGCSSGARGAMVSLDYVATKMAGLAQVVGLLDSAIWLPIRPQAHTLVSFGEQTREFLPLANASVFLDEDCVRGFPPRDRYKCLEGAFRLPFLRAPFFLIHSQYDLFGISMNVFGRFLPSAKLDEEQQHYAEYYRSQVVRYLPTPVMGSGTTVFSPACYSHCTLTAPAAYTIRADGVQLVDALSHWLQATSMKAATGWFRDRCAGFDCGCREEAKSVAGPGQGNLPAVENPTAQGMAGGPGLNSWEPRFLEDYPLAICNDGSPAAYYYRPGMAQSRQWLVFLEGAGWCWDATSCDIPWKIRLGTSIEFPRTAESILSWARTLKGVFDSTGRSPFKDWHIAYVRTCSNDAFLGDSSPREAEAARVRKPGPGWHFRGRRILEATFTDLQRRSGLGAMEGDLVLYGGCSSGGRGALVTLDYLASRYVGKADLVGLLDAPLWVPIQPFKEGLVSFDDQTRMFFDLANASGLISPECEAAYPGINRWKCLEAGFRLPFVHTPYFLSHSQYDVFGLTMNIFGHFYPGHYLTPMQKAYAEKYRTKVLKYLPTPAAGSGNAVFAPACYAHCMFSDVIFYIIDAAGVSLQQALHKWLNAVSADAATENLRDLCQGFNCGHQPTSQVQLPPPTPAIMTPPAFLFTTTGTTTVPESVLVQAASLLV